MDGCDARQEALFRRWKRGDKWSGQDLVESFRPEIKRLAMGQAGEANPLYVGSRGELAKDLEQEGMLGAWKALLKFEMEPGANLTKYAMKGAWLAISHYLCDKANFIRIPDKAQRAGVKPFAVMTSAAVTRQA